MSLFDPRHEIHKEIFSHQIPTNAKQGRVWSELDGVNGNLIETWKRFKNSWISPLKTLYYNSLRANSTDGRLQINSQHRIVLVRSRVLVNVYAVMTSGVQVEVSHFYFSTNGSTTTSQEITTKSFTSGLPNNGSFTQVRQINFSVQAQARDYLQILTRGVGSSISHSISAQIDYYLIRS